MQTVYWRKPRAGTIDEDPPADERTNVPDDSEDRDAEEDGDHAD